MAPKEARSSPTIRRPSALAAVTEVLADTARACWEIRGYSLLEKKEGVELRSPSIVEAAGARFQLGLFARGDTGCNCSPGHFSVYIFREADETVLSPINTLFEVTLVGKQERRGKKLLEPYRFEHSQKHGCGFKDFGRIQTLESPEFLVEDTLVFEIRLSAWADGQKRDWKLPAAPGASSGAAAQRAPSTLVAKDLAAFLAGGQATDVEVSSRIGDGGGQVVRARRVVLAARSPVFNRMLLESGMRESQAMAKVSLEEFDHVIVERFVHFLYSGELGQDSLEDQDSLCHLICLGHRFQVDSLVQLCSTSLQLAEDTAIERLLMAEQLGLLELKAQVVDYICSCRTRLAQVQETEAFHRMTRSHPQLLAELFSRVTQPAEKRARVASPPAAAAPSS